jgi:hypothetical protein
LFSSNLRCARETGRRAGFSIDIINPLRTETHALATGQEAVASPAQAKDFRLKVETGVFPLNGFVSRSAAFMSHLPTSCRTDAESFSFSTIFALTLRHVLQFIQETERNAGIPYNPLRKY